MSQLVTLYALGDPRDGRVRYIGSTSGSLAHRLHVHVYWSRTGRHKGAKGAWVREVVAAGLRPVAIALLTCAAADRVAAEAWLIRVFRRAGAGLTNAAEPVRPYMKEESHKW